MYLFKMLLDRKLRFVLAYCQATSPALIPVDKILDGVIPGA